LQVSGIRRIFASEKRTKNMAISMTNTKRTREEVLAWLQRARERKQAWEEQTQLELKAMIEENRRARESRYFEFPEGV